MLLVWHRAELRTHDNPALHAAARSGEPVLPLVILDPIIFGRATTTPRRQAWFLENVRALRESYRRLGSDLIVREGEPARVLSEIAREHGITTAHFVLNYTPYGKMRDAAARAALAAAGVAVHTYGGQYVHAPGMVLNGAGERYSVFTAYYRAWQKTPFATPLPAPRALPALPPQIRRGDIPRVKADIALPPVGEEAAWARFERFRCAHEKQYFTARDHPADADGSSRLSGYFNLGILSARLAARQTGQEGWRRELAWRDFNADILDRAPDGEAREFRPDWQGFPWRHDAEALARWREGATGIPILDAGMRELQATGFMHNRVRMIAASFLTKHLLIDWRDGEAVFRALLLDGDTAQNVGNWQWVAGCGFDAAPYFRVFNPVTQGEKFDPAGEYVQRWVPELRHVPPKLVHRPWEAGQLRADYPPPMVELAAGRQRFLATAQRFLKPA